MSLLFHPVLLSKGAREYDEIERKILWLYVRIDKLNSTLAVSGQSEIIDRFDRYKIDAAWTRLLQKGLVKGEMGGGNICSASKMDLLKHHFRTQRKLCRVWFLVKATWSFIIKTLEACCKYAVIPIGVSVITTIMTVMALKHLNLS